MGELLNKLFGMTTTPDYESQTKELLFAQIEQRGVHGVTPKSLKEDMIAALQLQDEQDKQDAAAKALLPDAPKQPDVPADDVVRSNPPVNTQFTEGRYRMVEGGAHAGEIFALAVHEADTYDRTHTLKNQEHFWQGTKAQFRANFEKA